MLRQQRACVRTVTELIRCAAIPKLASQVLLTDRSLPNLEFCFLSNSATKPASTN